MFLLLIFPNALNVQQDTLLCSQVHHAPFVVLGTILVVAQVFVVHARLVIILLTLLLAPVPPSVPVELILLFKELLSVHHVQLVPTLLAGLPLVHNVP